MSRRKRRTIEDEDPGLDMSSLIDVSFLLLIYFIVTSTIEPKEADLGMTMPTSQSDGTSDVEIDPMSITVDPQGAVVVNDEILDNNVQDREVPRLLERLVTYAESARLTDSEPIVIISADDGAKSQRFVDVLNALSDPKVDIKAVTIAGFDEE